MALLRTRATAARAGEGQGPDPLRVGSEGLLRRGAGTRPRRKGTEGLEAGARQQPRDAQVAGALRPGALVRCRLGSRSF